VRLACYLVCRLLQLCYVASVSRLCCIARVPFLLLCRLGRGRGDRPQRDPSRDKPLEDRADRAREGTRPHQSVRASQPSTRVHHQLIRTHLPRMHHPPPTLLPPPPTSACTSPSYKHSLSLVPVFAAIPIPHHSPASHHHCSPQHCSYLEQAPKSSGCAVS